MGGARHRDRESPGPQLIDRGHSFVDHQFFGGSLPLLVIGAWFAAGRLDGLGLLDSLIAATAVGHGSVLNTFNDRHYRMFPGLTIVRPYRR